MQGNRSKRGVVRSGYQGPQKSTCEARVVALLTYGENRKVMVPKLGGADWKRRDGSGTGGYVNLRGQGDCYPCEVNKQGSETLEPLTAWNRRKKEKIGAAGKSTRKMHGQEG